LVNPGWLRGSNTIALVTPNYSDCNAEGVHSFPVREDGCMSGLYAWEGCFQTTIWGGLLEVNVFSKPRFHVLVFRKNFTQLFVPVTGLTAVEGFSMKGCTGGDSCRALPALLQTGTLISTGSYHARLKVIPQTKALKE
jgi:hypothetical protein